MPRETAPLPENTPPTIFYLPCLHPALAPAPVPAEVYFLNPGLTPAPQGASLERIWTPAGLPYDPRRAAQCLQDLLAQGQSLGHDLLLTSGHAATLGALATPTMSEAESRALKAFAADGRFADRPDGQAQASADEKKSAQSRREQAQKRLLLCYHWEDNMLSARELMRNISASEAALRELLQGDGLRMADAAGPDATNLDTAGPGTAGQDTADPDTADLDAAAAGVGVANLAAAPSDPADLPSLDFLAAGDDAFAQYLSRWQDILRSWQVLLPEGAVFYTSDLQALPGVDLGAARPLAPEDAARLFPASLQAGWTFSVLTLPAACGQEVSLISGRAPDS